MSFIIIVNGFLFHSILIITSSVKSRKDKKKVETNKDLTGLVMQ